MHEDYVSLEQAKAMKTAGFPQMAYPSTEYWRPLDYQTKKPLEEWIFHWAEDADGYSESDTEVLAAPTILRALMWCEEQGYFWECHVETADSIRVRCWSVRLNNERSIFNNPSGLLTAILSRMAAPQPASSSAGKPAPL